MAAKRIPVIIDTDPGVDDAFALLLALASPEIEILAITVCFGNTEMDACWYNVLRIFDIVARHIEKYPEDRARFPNFESSIYLAKGCDHPIDGVMHKAEYFHGRDGLADITTRHPDLTVRALPQGETHHNLVLSSKRASELSIDLIESRDPRAITYIALGPLSNLAEMLRHEKGKLVVDRLGQVVCMGGALDVPGNTSAVAEFNFFADPYAVNEVLGLSEHPQGLSFPHERFIILPLDVTTPHELSMPGYRGIVDPAFENTKKPSIPGDKSPITHFTSSILERTREVMISYGKDAMELHDVVAVWCACMNPPHPEPIVRNNAPLLATGWSYQRRTFKIERIGELTRGMLVVDRRDDASLDVYGEGANRAEWHERLDIHHTPAPVQIDIDEADDSRRATEEMAMAMERTEQAGFDRVGVPCVVGTPGPGVLLNLMYRRIWGAVES